MARKTRSARLPLPGRQWLQKASFALLAAFGVTLLVMSKTHSPAAENLRAGLMDVATPLLAVAASPLQAVHSVAIWGGEMVALREDNIALKNQNRELLKWQLAAREMQTENLALRELLNVVPAKTSRYVTARMVSGIGNPYAHSALIAGGRDQGIRKDQAVIAEHGLIGRVMDTSEKSARVLLLSDINSRVPVMGEKTREKTMLVGDGSALPILSYLPVASEIAVGERLVTSGDGGMFPAGIPVGVVASIDRELNQVRVQPFVDPAQVTMVSIVDYQL